MSRIRWTRSMVERLQNDVDSYVTNGHSKQYAFGQLAVRYKLAAASVENIYYEKSKRYQKSAHRDTTISPRNTKRARLIINVVPTDVTRIIGVLASAGVDYEDVQLTV